MLVSFIIPSYNSAHTVKRCLDSIYALSLKPEEFEVIFIDDCSTDNTCDIVAEYQSRNSNITLLKQAKNNRQGAARNRGVSVAKGEYICFVDSDDAVTEGIVEAIRAAKERQTDMMIVHYADVNEQGTITRERGILGFSPEKLFTGIEMQSNYPYWCPAPWGYIYSRDFLTITHYPFCEGVLYEDADYVVVHMYYAQRMSYFPHLSYLSYYREDSTTHRITYKNLADYLLLGLRMLRFYEDIVNSHQEYVGSGVDKFADGILEGACQNVVKSCERLIKLRNIHEVCLYYQRVDEYVRRQKLCADRQIRRYYWNNWTSLCLGHKYITIMFLSFLMPIYSLMKKLQKLYNNQER